MGLDSGTQGQVDHAPALAAAQATLAGEEVGSVRGVFIAMHHPPNNVGAGLWNLLKGLPIDTATPVVILHGHEHAGDFVSCGYRRQIGLRTAYVSHVYSANAIRHGTAHLIETHDGRVTCTAVTNDHADEVPFD